MLKHMCLILAMITLSASLLTGCLRFGPDADTVKPDKTQVEQCRTLLGINPDLEIVPLGYKAVYGIDDAVWFKFSVKSEAGASISRIINPPENTPVLHSEGVGRLPVDNGSKWWDLGDKEVTWCESWTDPEGRWCLSWTGITEGKYSLVYVFWNEL